MARRMRNPLRGSWNPVQLSGRILKFLLRGLGLMFVGANRKAFGRIVARQAGLADPARLPDRPRLLALTVCSLGTFFIFLAIAYLFASSWSALWAAAAGISCYVLAGAVLSRVLWGLPAAFRREGRLIGILRRVWEVIRNGVP